jgi:uncharacterized protein (DUF2147 family)
VAGRIPEGNAVAVPTSKQARKYENLMRSSLVLCLVLSAVLGSLSTPARGETSAQGIAETSPVGRWKTVDDATGKVKSVVTIWEEAGKLYGRIQKLVDPDPHDPNPRCTPCTGDQKGRPVIGLKILWDLQKDGDAWSGGTILDPESGKTYKCLLSIEDGGAKLKVRGFIGVSLLGRTQYWLRDQ